MAMMFLVVLLATFCVTHVSCWHVDATTLPGKPDNVNV